MVADAPDFRARCRQWLASPTLHRLVELALTHTATFAFPLVFAVVCGRVLGVNEYGVAAFYTSLAAFLGMVVEFGFNWYGVREVASNLKQPQQCHRVLINISAAKLLVWAIVAVLTCAILLLLRGMHEWPLMLAWSAYMLGFAADTAWYLQAHERTRVLLAVTTGVRLGGIALLVVLVTALESTAAALWSYAMVSLSASALLWAVLLRSGLVQWSKVEFQYVKRLLRGASAIVVGNLNGSFLTNGGVALLGLSADAAVVASANLALRLRMAAEGAMMPLHQLGYVRLSARAQRSLPEFLRLGRKVLVVNLFLSTLLAAGCMLVAPTVSVLVFKEELPLAVSLMVLVALSLPLHSVGVLFGVQSLVSLGREGPYALIQIGASIVFCVALLLNTSPQSYGWAVVVSEAFVVVFAALVLSRQFKRGIKGIKGDSP